MLGKGHLALLLDQLFGLHPVVEVQLHFLQPLEHACLVVDRLQAEFLFQVLRLVEVSLRNLLVAVDGHVLALLDLSTLN